ncbi:MAG: SpoIIE family protein phosphatase [Verrucomicrobiales bacterium]
MSKPLRALIIEDSDFDAQLILHLLKKGGYKVEHRRVETADELRDALKLEWNLVIADYNLPSFSAPEALEMVQKSGHDWPFIVVSGAIGEGTAVAAMKAGAHDYLMKDNLTRLVPVIERELREAANREARRHAKEALLLSEMRYRLLWETATDAVIMFDRDGRINFANPAVVEVFGYQPGELKGESVFLLQRNDVHWEPQQGIREFLRASPEGEENRKARETVGIKKDGAEFPMELAMSHMEMEGEDWFVGFFRDITERKRTEAELLKSQEQFRVAHDIQQHLFPETPPLLPGFDIAGSSYPAEATGGDYFDYLFMPGGCIGVVVGDVSGHGVGPALLMAETRAYLRILARTNDNIGKVLSQANEVLAEDVGLERYVTMFLTKLDPTDRSMCYINAGHVPGYHFNSKGEIIGALKRTGVPLGLRPKSVYEPSGNIQLEAGQVLLLLTDGFEEAVCPDETFFGTERVFEVVRRMQNRPAREILSALYEELRNFTRDAPQLDDLTAIVIKVN